MNVLLTGPVHSGKTSLLKNLVEELEGSGKSTDGFLSISLWQSGSLLGYDLHTIQKRTVIPFIRKKGKKEWERVGPFFFLPEGLRQAQKIILNPAPKDILIVDEIGPLELSGQGLWPAFSRIVQNASFTILCVVRKTILEDFLKSMSGKQWHIIDIEEKNTLPRLLERLRRISTPAT